MQISVDLALFFDAFIGYKRMFVAHKVIVPLAGKEIFLGKKVQEKNVICTCTLHLRWFIRLIVRHEGGAECSARVQIMQKQREGPLLCKREYE